MLDDALSAADPLWFWQRHNPRIYHAIKRGELDPLAGGSGGKLVVDFSTAAEPLSAEACRALHARLHTELQAHRLGLAAELPQRDLTLQFLVGDSNWSSWVLQLATLVLRASGVPHGSTVGWHPQELGAEPGSTHWVYPRRNPPGHTREPFNMFFQRRSRPRVRPGDVFAYQVFADRWHFLQVVRTDLGHLVFQVSKYLLYFYSQTAPSPDDIPPLARDDLLFPPVLTDCGMWTDGFALRVAQRPPDKYSCYDRHCFYSASHSDNRKRYCDDDKQPVLKPFHPCSWLVYTQIGGIDADVSTALGIPRMPVCRDDWKPKRSH